MSLLTITWDNDQLLLLSSRKNGNKTVYDRAIAISLRPSVEPGTDLSESSLYLFAVSPAMIAREAEAAAESGIDPRHGANAVSSPLLHPLLQSRLKAVIVQEKLLHSDTVVVLGRGGTEVRGMSLPYVPIEEIPDIVRFQAGREFSGYEPNSPIDYFLLNDDSNDSDFKDKRRHILASTIRSTLLNDIELLCEEAGLNLRRVVLRPCELTSSWGRQPDFDRNKTYLLAELGFKEASLTIVYGGKPVFMRSPKLTSAPFSVTKPDKSGEYPSINSKEELSDQLLAEIKRTLVAAQSEVQGVNNVNVDEIVLYGDETHHREISERLTKSLRIPVVTFDPWKDVALEGDLKKRNTLALPPAPERFASLIAAADQATLNRPSDIDYYNPKKKPESVGKQQRMIAVAVALVLLLLGSIAYGYHRKSTLQKNYLAESTRKEMLKEESDKAKIKSEQAAAVSDWEALNVNWLDEISWLSNTIPGAPDLMLMNLNCRSYRGTGVNANTIGSMIFQGVAKDATILPPLEEQLRDSGKHRVWSGNKAADRTRPNYNLKFDMTILVNEKKEF